MNVSFSGGGTDATGASVTGNTTVEVGTFKLKVHTNVTLVLKADDGTTSTVSNSTDEERRDGGWEFSGPGATGNHRVGSWASPDGFFKAQWDLTFR